MLRTKNIQSKSKFRKGHDLTPYIFQVRLNVADGLKNVGGNRKTSLSIKLRTNGTAGGGER